MGSFQDKVLKLHKQNYPVQEIARLLNSRTETVQFVLDASMTVSRAERIRMLFEENMSLQDIVTYTNENRHYVYRILYASGMIEKGESKRGVYVDYKGIMYRRADLIRMLYNDGMPKTQIAKELGVNYTIVYSALRPHSKESILNTRNTRQSKAESDDEYEME